MTDDTRRHAPKKHANRPPQAAGKPGLEARQVATKVLGAVLERQLSLDGALDAEHGSSGYRNLSEADRGLVRAILNTALRQLPRIEHCLSIMLDTPLPAGAKALQHLLVVGASQILYLDVPDHAAVDLAVEQANRDPRSRRFAKLVNALMRRMSREKTQLLESVSAVSPLPAWFFERLSTVYGEAAAKAIAEAQLEPAAIDLTVKGDAEGWAARLGGIVLPTGSVRLAPFDGSIPSLSGFSDGEWWVQDAAASIPARLLGDLSGLSVADLCAAPGGKTAQLIMAGGAVTALDLSANRLKRLADNLDRLSLSAKLVAADAATYVPETPFDAVLLDAPCSSTGTTRRHPDVPWTKGPEDVAKLAGVQGRLLRHAVGLVKPGGRIVFSNCSLDPLEGEAMVARLLNEMPEIERVAVTPAQLPGLEEAITALGEVRTTPAMLAVPSPYASGMDGFYAVVLRRRA